jgi:HSP20 family molecular chaperone IbpA
MSAITCSTLPRNGSRSVAAEALYHNGLFMLTMPKAEHSKPRQIQVQV